MTDAAPGERREGGDMGKTNDQRAWEIAGTVPSQVYAVALCHLREVAAEARAEEREACAEMLVKDSQVILKEIECGQRGGEYGQLLAKSLTSAAERIRARGERGES